MNFNAHFPTLFKEVSPQTASFSFHNHFYGIIKTTMNSQWDNLWKIFRHLSLALIFQLIKILLSIIDKNNKIISTFLMNEWINQWIEAKDRFFFYHSNFYFHIISYILIQLLTFYDCFIFLCLLRWLFAFVHKCALRDLFWRAHNQILIQIATVSNW